MEEYEPFLHDILLSFTIFLFDSESALLTFCAVLETFGIFGLIVHMPCKHTCLVTERASF